MASLPPSGSNGFARPLRDRSFRAIFVSLLASSVGDWAARIALAVLVVGRTGSASLSALVVAVSFLPWMGPGQLLAARLSHWPRVRVMVGADLLRAAVYAVLLLPFSTGVLLGLVFVAALATPPFETARSTLTVEAVRPEDYGSAIALLDITDQSAIVVGYLLGGIWVLVGGYRLALLADVASFLVSAGALSRVVVGRQVGRAVRAGTQLRRGLWILWSEPVIRRGVLVLILAGLPVAAIEATAAAYADLVLHANADVAGELAAAVPVGILLVIPVLPRLGGARRLLRVAAVVALIGGVVGAAAFSAGRLPGAIVGYMAAGVLSASGTPAQIAFQPRIPAADRTGVFSLAQGLLMGAQAFGAAVGGVVAGLAGPRRGALGWMILVVIAAAGLVAVPVGAGDPEDQSDSL